VIQSELAKLRENAREPALAKLITDSLITDY
jgi:hypothetical protein